MTGNDRGPDARNVEAGSGHTTTSIVPSTSVDTEVIDTVRRAGVLLVGLADRLDTGRADLPLAVEQLAELLRDVLVVVARTTEVDR